MKKKVLKQFAVTVMSTVLAFSSAAGLALPVFAAEDDDWEDEYAFIAAYALDDSIEEGETTIGYADVYTNMEEDAIINWYAEDESIVSVSGAGSSCRIRGLKPGRTRVIANLRIAGGNADNDSFTIKVKAKQPEKISVTDVNIKDENVRIKVGESYKLTAYVSPSNADNRKIYWSSDNSEIASVDSSGTVRGKNRGNTRISVKTDEGGHKDHVYVSVEGESVSDYVAPQKVWLNPTSLTMGTGEEFYITPNFYPTNADHSVTWSSSNPGVATVSSNGKVNAKAAGQTIVTCLANNGGKYDTTVVNVVTKPAAAAAVPTAPLATNPTRNPAFLYGVVVTILQAAPNAVVTIPAEQPMAYDANVAAALVQRPDVTLSATFPFQGHRFVMTLPKGYNLASKLDASGFAEWLYLCSLQPEVSVVMQN